tara:strand:+ start:682 stop:969 length:288 start_codon:yes stop_codon:yes gene_type:complete
MYGTQNIDLQAMIEHGLNTEEWIWKYFQPIKDFERDIQNEMTNLRKERIKLGLSMSECARRADVPFRTWQKWELGTRRTPDLAFKLLKGIESNIY